MNKTFTIINKINNVPRVANTIVKFSQDNKNYLIYSIDENEQNRQIFVSKLVVNSEGKNFIEDILPEEKNKLSNLVYNIVILIPTNYSKGENPETLIKNLSDKYAIKLSNEIPNVDNQDYFANCSIAITSKTLVDSAVAFYSEYLKEENGASKEIPMWTVPIEEHISTETVEKAPSTPEIIVPVVEPVVNAEVSMPVNNSTISLTPAEPVVEPIPAVTPSLEVPSANLGTTPVDDVTNTQESNLPNPQAEKLAIVSDPNLANAMGMQPNLGKNKKAGFASNKYIIIGTICLLLAVAVVVAAVILIKNK